MNIHVEGSLLDLTPSVVTYIKEKINPLERMLLNLAQGEEVVVFVKLARVSKHHRHGDVFNASISIKLPGKILRATHAAMNARAAIDMVRETLRSDIARHKSKTLQARRPRRPR